MEESTFPAPRILVSSYGMYPPVIIPLLSSVPSMVIARVSPLLLKDIAQSIVSAITQSLQKYLTARSRPTIDVEQETTSAKSTPCLFACYLKDQNLVVSYGSGTLSRIKISW